MLEPILDVFRMRQYFDVLVGARDLIAGVRDDVGFPIAAGITADATAAFTLGLRPRDYVDVDWHRSAVLAPTFARGFAGIIRGERLEATYGELLGDMTLGEMPIPAYAPTWNIERNCVEYLGPRTYPNVTVARAVHEMPAPEGV